MSNINKTFDALLVLQCQSGNKKAITILVKRWHKKLCKQANWYIRDKEISKDIAQDSWSVILLKIHTLKDANSFGSWALTIVTRKSLDWLRKNKKEQEGLNVYKKETYQDILENETKEVSEDKKKLLKNVIKTLPRHQQMVLHLFYKEEYSIKQISEILDISTGTVKSRLFTAREKLKSILENRNHE